MTADKKSFLPPRALLIALLVQIPWLVLRWPRAWSPAWLAAGGAAMLAGAWLNLAADRRFRTAQVGVCPFSATPRLVLDGPYRFTRNPMYLGMTLLATTPALLAGLPLNLLAAAGFALWVDRAFIRREERFLEQQFGSAYQAYRIRVWRWLGASILEAEHRAARNQ